MTTNPPGDQVTDLNIDKKPEHVQDMFTQIAHRYDLMNRFMTGGQDVRWRKWVIEKAELPGNGRLLDLGAGTGDLAYEAIKQHPGCFTLAADFTLEMMRVGKNRRSENSRLLHWTAADATRLPFPDKAFDAVISGFLLRNVNNIKLSLREQYRVLKPGGRFVSLDTTPPPNNLLAPFMRFHLHTIIPALGKILTGQAAAYHYLPDSTENFLRADVLADHLVEAGFQQVGYKRHMFGAVAIHWGRKPN